ncbi:hypothetical protein COD14_30905 [Bacillus cereus]|nr:hypothetical protein COD14_30905 [Bacillus cereus]
MTKNTYKLEGSFILYVRKKKEKGTKTYFQKMYYVKKRKFLREFAFPCMPNNNSEMTLYMYELYILFIHISNKLFEN